MCIYQQQKFIVCCFSRKLQNADNAYNNMWELEASAPADTLLSCLYIHTGAQIYTTYYFVLGIFLSPFHNDIVIGDLTEIWNV